MLIFAYILSKYWAEIKHIIYILQGQVYGYEAYPIETIRKLWKTKASKRYSDMVSDMKEKNAKPIFMSQAIWEQWLQHWNRPEVKDRSKKASTNRNSNPTLHSCGSISIQEHAVKLVKFSCHVTLFIIAF